MKTILTVILIITGIFGYSQAHLGQTSDFIVDYHSDIDFEIVETDTETGEKLMAGEFEYGTFYYILDMDYICQGVFQIPYGISFLNKQAAVYNQIYAPISGAQWKAYLQHGVMDISVVYNDNLETLIFVYTRE